MRGEVCQGETGFTLVELLVALGVLALASGLLFSSLHMARFTAHGRLEAAGDDTIPAAQRVLVHGLEQALAVNGNRATLHFLAPPPDRKGPDALQRYRLVKTRAGDLILYNASTLLEGVNWRSTPLLKRVQAMEFAYYGRDRAGAPPRWRSSWPEGERTPELVRLRLRLAPGDGRSWPDLVVRPRARSTDHCRIDLASGQCEPA